jgi:hypothetical protein
MKEYRRVDVWIHVFFTSALVRGEWSASCLGRFTSGGMSPRYPLDRTLGGSKNRSGWRREEKFLILLGLELRPLRRPTRSWSPYRLRYPVFYYISMTYLYKQNDRWDAGCRRLSYCYRVLSVQRLVETLKSSSFNRYFGGPCGPNLHGLWLRPARNMQ